MASNYIGDLQFNDLSDDIQDSLIEHEIRLYAQEAEEDSISCSSSDELEVDIDDDDKKDDSKKELESNLDPEDEEYGINLLADIAKKSDERVFKCTMRKKRTYKTAKTYDFSKYHKKDNAENNKNFRETIKMLHLLHIGLHSHPEEVMKMPKKQISLISKRCKFNNDRLRRAWRRNLRIFAVEEHFKSGKPNIPFLEFFAPDQMEKFYIHFTGKNALQVVQHIKKLKPYSFVLKTTNCPIGAKSMPVDYRGQLTDRDKEIILGTIDFSFNKELEKKLNVKLKSHQQCQDEILKRIITRSRERRIKKRETNRKCAAKKRKTKEEMERAMREELKKREEALAASMKKGEKSVADQGGYCVRSIQLKTIKDPIFRVSVSSDSGNKPLYSYTEDKAMSLRGLLAQECPDPKPINFDSVLSQDDIKATPQKDFFGNDIGTFGHDGDEIKEVLEYEFPDDPSALENKVDKVSFDLFPALR